MDPNYVTCPLEIEIALHYHCMGTQYRNGDFSAPSVNRGIQRLVKAGLLQTRSSWTPTEPTFEGTPALKIYVEALCKTPFPVMKWVMP